MKGLGQGAGFEAFLMFGDGSRLNEHAVEHKAATRDKGGSCFSWAECVEGQSFKVVLVRHRRKGKRFAVEVRFNTNGRRIDDAAWFARERECHFDGMYEQAQDGLYKLPLVFAPQQTTEDLCDANMRDLEAMSTISITLHRGTYRSAPPDNTTRVPGDCVQTVYEKHSKLGSTVVGGEGVMVEEAEPFDLHYFYPAENHPETLYEFKWKYGVKDRLIVVKIIPDATPTLPRLATKRMRRPTVDAVEGDDSDRSSSSTVPSSTRTEDSKEHVMVPSIVEKVKRKKQKRGVGVIYSKTSAEGRLLSEESGVDNPIDLSMLSDGEDGVPVPVASESGTGREAVKTEQNEE